MMRAIKASSSRRNLTSVLDMASSTAGRSSEVALATAVEGSMTFILEALLMDNEVARVMGGTTTETLCMGEETKQDINYSIHKKTNSRALPTCLH